MQSTTLSVPTDEEGYLIEPAHWTESIARELAAAEGIELTDVHWDVLYFMRTFQTEHQVTPDARFVMRHLSETRGEDRNALFRLFPYGYVKQACKIAGMKRPRAWSTG